MPNTTWTTAIKEAYASAPEGVVLLHSFVLEHPGLPAGSLYFVEAVEDYDLTLEDATTHTFVASQINMSLPPAGDKGVQTINIGFDNVDRSVSDFFNSVKEFRQPAKLTYRPYLSNDLATPQMDPPLELNLTDVKVRTTSVTARATFADLVNKKHPLELYTRSRFASLGG